MKSMKITAAERKERDKKYKNCGPCSVDGGDAYPYGLRLDLNDEVLEKLGITSLPQVGKTMTLTAKVKITGTRENQREGGEKNRSMDLQITDLELGAGSVTDAVRDALKA